MRGSILLIVSIIFCNQKKPEGTVEIGYKQFIKNFRMLETEAGIKTWELKADSAYVYDEYIKVYRLNLLFFEPKGETTALVRAPLGRLHNKTHDLVALGGVEVTTFDRSSLTTDSLCFDNESTLIKTESAVSILRPDGTKLSGRGLVTTPDLTRIKIGGKITGETPFGPGR